MIAGDELYTRVHKNMAPEESHGWTIALMDRATRFLWDMHCGRKDRKLFKHAMRLLCEVIEQTGDVTLLTDGERRYGNLLFELCSQALRTGKRGRPKKTLPKGVKVRLKNKGSQRHKRGRKRPKYQAPYPEHPDTPQPLATTEIHANHLEAFHAGCDRAIPNPNLLIKSFAYKIKYLLKNIGLLSSPGSYANTLDAGP
jgi:hypothetical protein